MWGCALEGRRMFYPSITQAKTLAQRKEAPNQPQVNIIIIKSIINQSREERVNYEIWKCSPISSSYRRTAPSSYTSATSSAVPSFCPNTEKIEQLNISSQERACLLLLCLLRSCSGIWYIRPVQKWDEVTEQKKQQQKWDTAEVGCSRQKELKSVATVLKIVKLWGFTENFRQLPFLSPATIWEWERPTVPPLHTRALRLEFSKKWMFPLLVFFLLAAAAVVVTAHSMRMRHSMNEHWFIWFW